MARRKHRELICAHKVRGNASRPASAARNARAGRACVLGTAGSRWAYRDSALDDIFGHTGLSTARLACSKSSGRRVLTQVPLPVLLSRYPSECNWSNTVTTVPRETPEQRASSRVDGRRVPRLKRPSRMADRNSSDSHWNREVPFNGAAKTRSNEVIVLATSNGTPKNPKMDLRECHETIYLERKEQP